MENWGTFATVAGGAAAGLTGLLFVAVSIRIEVIAKSQELRNRAHTSFWGAARQPTRANAMTRARACVSAWLLLTKIPE